MLAVHVGIFPCIRSARVHVRQRLIVSCVAEARSWVFTIKINTKIFTYQKYDIKQSTKIRTDEGGSCLREVYENVIKKMCKRRRHWVGNTSYKTVREYYNVAVGQKFWCSIFKHTYLFVSMYLASLFVIECIQVQCTHRIHLKAECVRIINVKK